MTGRRWPEHAIRAAAVGLVLLMAPATTLGHGGAYLTVEPSTISPGGGGAVRGVGFGSGAPVVLVLITPSGDEILGTVETDGEGSFATVIRLPSDSTAGTRRLDARSENHVESVEVTIVGAPTEDGGEGRRDEEEPLLVPISPLPAQGAPEAPRPSSDGAMPVNPAAEAQQFLGVIGGAAILVAAVVGGLVARQRRRPRLKDST